MKKLTRPSMKQIDLRDGFWAPYLEQIRTVTLPYVFDRMEEHDYFDGFRMVTEGIRGQHKRMPYYDGLVFETIRGASDFLAWHPDPALDQRLDGYIEQIRAAQDAGGDGYLCTKTTCEYPQWRWGRNGGDIIIQHDLYDHGALIEAAISHYLATKKTTLLSCAVKAANRICADMGPSPKLNVIPGHSLSEEAFVKLYRLFRDHRELDEFADRFSVDPKAYLDMAEFWYDNRGNYRDRCLSADPKFIPRYNQDHLPFSAQRTAEGHAVRAGLCYVGAAALAYETGRADYKEALQAIWENIVHRKLHVSGGIGTRHDIEGFDVDFNLPHDAYLETCAAISLAFFNGEMALLTPKSVYFDVFERSLYNNILAAVGEDKKHFFYQNPLISDGKVARWEWHKCPCCPPMLLKLFSILPTYAYAYSEDSLYVNLYMDTALHTETVDAELSRGTLRVDSHGREMTLCLRLPGYGRNPRILVNGVAQTLTVKEGYALLTGIWDKDTAIEICFDLSPRLVVSDHRVAANRGLVSVAFGPTVFCAEAIDNQGSVDFSIDRDATLSQVGENLLLTNPDGESHTLIPYYRWCNRDGGAMRVWFPCVGEAAPENTDGLYRFVK